MHDFIYSLGILGLIIIFFYIVFWLDRRKKPSDFDLIRNHLQSITHLNLIVRGHGKYFIEYKDHYDHVFHYYHQSEYRKWLGHYQESENINIIQHGLSSNRAWEKWDLKK